MRSPDFVIAGAYRAGTTTLRLWMAAHPEVYMPSLAEPSFFAFDDGRYPPHMLEGANDPFRRRRTTTLETYENLFVAAPVGAQTGECSPEYLRARGSAERLAAARPDCKVLITLRNPVDRAISDWKMCRRDGVETLSLLEAIEAADERNASGAFGGHYLETSRYSAGLQEFFEHVPRENILVLIHERWTADPTATARRLGDFLGIDHRSFDSDLPLSNVSGVPTSRLAGLAWSMRRRAAPILAPRVPHGMRRALDRRLENLLDTSIDTDERNEVGALLAEDARVTRRLLDDEVPEWT